MLALAMLYYLLLKPLMSLRFSGPAPSASPPKTEAIIPKPWNHFPAHVRMSSWLPVFKMRHKIIFYSTAFN